MVFWNYSLSSETLSFKLNPTLCNNFSGHALRGVQVYVLGPFRLGWIQNLLEACMFVCTFLCYPVMVEALQCFCYSVQTSAVVDAVVQSML